jgi:hypothetical protein
MVEPLFSSTPTSTQVWLVLCEVSPTYPGVDVYAHMWWKWKWIVTLDLLSSVWKIGGIGKSRTTAAD